MKLDHLAAVLACGFLLCATPTYTQTEDASIRPFKAKVPQADLNDLRTRLKATRWPDKETVGDRSQGAQLASLQELVRYWGTTTTGAKRKPG
jgi:hypothetical protein